jgi:hypothetical protein
MLMQKMSNAIKLTKDNSTLYGVTEISASPAKW